MGYIVPGPGPRGPGLKGPGRVQVFALSFCYRTIQYTVIKLGYSKNINQSIHY